MHFPLRMTVNDRPWWIINFVPMRLARLTSSRPIPLSQPQSNCVLSDALVAELPIRCLSCEEVITSSCVHVWPCFDLGRVTNSFSKCIMHSVNVRGFIRDIRIYIQHITYKLYNKSQEFTCQWWTVSSYTSNNRRVASIIIWFWHFDVGSREMYNKWIFEDQVLNNRFMKIIDHPLIWLYMSLLDLH